MIIQFSHNGQELNLSKRSKKNNKAYEFDNSITKNNHRYWNNEPVHKRKFIKHHGWYLEKDGDTFNPKPKKADLYFWGEWEPQSKFELTGNKYSSSPSLPHAVHYPVFSKNGIGGHNTDPFIFGDHFYYTNCKQKQTGKGKKMLNLPNYSIILFGSEKNKSEFIIDTVFVVNSSETVANYIKQQESYPTILREATIDLHNGLPDWHKLYQGKMYDCKNITPIKKTSTFCFFPCKVDCGITGFERPTINWEKFNLQKPGAGTVLKEIKNKTENNFWHDLVTELLKQGFYLGIKLYMPHTNDNDSFPEYTEVNTNC